MGNVALCFTKAIVQSLVGARKARRQMDNGRRHGHFYLGLLDI